MRLFLFLLSLLVLASSAQAENIVPESRAAVVQSFSPIVKKAAPAVVNIYTRKMVKQRLVSPLLDDPFFQQFFGRAMNDGAARQRMEKSLGSGVLVRGDGLIVTNNHVIAGADQITVVLQDRHEYEATLLTTDTPSDLAVLKINTQGKTLPALDLADSDTAEVGDLVLAIGNPFGVGQTVTNGIVSALARSSVDINDLNYFIQTDAPINPGNSGGALVGMDGKLIGINSAIFTRSGGSMGIGFAIPANMVKAVIKAVSEGKKSVVRPWTGIGGQEVTSDVATSMNLSQASGVLVNTLHAASPAKKAGLQVGDVIMAVNGKNVEDPSAFRFRIATLSIGGKATLDVLHHGKKETVTLDLVAPPEDPPRDQTTLKGKNPLSGCVVMNLSPAVSEELGFHDADQGVVVTEVASGSIAGRFGLQPGDVIDAVNDQTTPTVKTLQKALSDPSVRWKISITRGDQTLNLLVGG